jgi:hypothetical protein
VAGTVAVAGMLAPLVLFGDRPSPLSMLLSGVGLTGTGVVLRLGGGNRQRAVGAVIAIVGTVWLVGSLVLLWILVQGIGY